jgi:hypothetical protein
MVVLYVATTMRFLELGIITPHKIAGVAIDWAAFCMPTNKQCRWWRPEWKELVERKKLVERVQLQSYGIRLQCTQEVGTLLSLFVCKCSFVSCRIGILVWKSCCWSEQHYGFMYEFSFNCVVQMS